MFVCHLGTYKGHYQHIGQRRCLQGMLRSEEWVKLYLSEGDDSWEGRGAPEGAQHSQPQLMPQSCLAVLLCKKAQVRCFLFILSLCMSKQSKSQNHQKKIHTDSLSSGFEQNFESSRSMPSPSARFELVKGTVCVICHQKHFACGKGGRFRVPRWSWSSVAGSVARRGRHLPVRSVQHHGQRRSARTAAGAGEGQSPVSVPSEHIPRGPRRAGHLPSPAPGPAERLDVTGRDELEAYEANCILG